MAVQLHALHGKKPGLEARPQGEEPLALLGKEPQGLLQGHRQAVGQEGAWRPSPPPPLLLPRHQGEKLHPVAHQKGPDPLGPVELVGAQGDQVRPHLVHGEGHLAYGLHRVGVEEGPVGVGHLGHGPHRVEVPQLVVGGHDAHQKGVGAEGLGHLLRVDHAQGVRLQVGDGEAKPLQKPQGPKKGGVLHRRADHVAPAPGQGHPQDGQGIGLRARGGEDHLPGAHPKEGCHPLPGPLQEPPGLLAKAVDAIGVAEDPLHLPHGLEDLGQT